VRVDQPARAAWTDGVAGFHPLTAGFPDGLQLLGYAGGETATAGQSSALLLFWKAVAPAPRADQLRLELRAADGQLVEQRDVPLATAEYPAACWQAGDVLSEQYRLPIDAKLPGGDYRLAIRPLPSGGDSPTAPGPEVLLGKLAIQPGPPPPAATPPTHPLAFTLGGKIALTGYDLASGPLRPGDQLDLTLHWADLAPVDLDYTVFVHVLDSSEKVVAQRDQPPAAGARPTSSWFPDDAILDRYAIALPATLPPGDYAVEVGLYNPTDGARLPVATDGKPAGDRIVIARITVGGGT
jgi:hypothetical protein